MDEDTILERINSCLDCKECNEVCDTFLVTQNELQSPNGRLQIAKKVFMDNEEISEDERFGLYTCTLCSLCDLTCVQEIPISTIIHASKVKLVAQNKAPYDIQNKIIQGIIEKDNSVNGKPEERLDWLPEKYRENEIYEKKDSDTLLFLGCMSSFRVKESASTSYEILKKAGFNFKIFKNEPCCGEYVYSAGKLDLAKKMFHDNYESFQNHGIKNIIVTCSGCLYAFNEVYPKYIKNWNINVKHVVQIIHDLAKQNKFKFKSLNKSITYHDACRMGRKLHNMDIYKEPRYLLNKCGITVEDLKAKFEDSPCCGSGAGVRGVDSELCINIGAQIINNIKTNEIISSCPLCIFNFRYVNYKKQLGKEYKYITDYILESIEEK